MKELALITGASSGIGREIARLLAARNFHLILVARRTEKLLELKEELELQHGIMAHVMPRDLSDPASAQRLYDEIREKELQVTTLINNAGFGTYGAFTSTDPATQLSMIQVNISSLVLLTRLFSADMKAVGKGRIMNVASILSFFPFPYYSVYAATKAFVLSFSEALQTELNGSGVTVTTLCPGPTDTEFNTEEILNTNAYGSMKPIAARVVAEQGVNAMLKGKRTTVVGFMNTFLVNTPRFSPRWLTLKINKHMASQRS